MRVSNERITRIVRRLAVLALAAWLGAACSTTPLTNRVQLRLVSEAQMASMSAETYDEMLAEEPVIDSGPEVTRIKRVGIKIARAAENGSFPWSERGTYTWDFRVIRRDDVLNAWALPGGKVAVYTGILKLVESDDELATVIAHEIAHAILRHGNERFSHEMTATGAAILADAALKDQSAATKDIFVKSIGAGNVRLPFSRFHELEADEIGLLLMAAAGYDPRASIGFWQRMIEMSEGPQVPQILSTHPSHENRIEGLEEHMDAALAIFEGERKL